MYKALACVVLVGAGIGAMMPAGDPAPVVEPAPSAAKDTAPAEIAREPEVTRVPRQPNGHFYVDATVNGQYVRFLVDTGASFVALSTEDASRVGVDFDKSRFEEVGSGASGPVHGQLLSLDHIEVQGKRVENVRGAVIEGLDVSLLGQTYLERMGSIEIAGDEMVIRPRA